jgi:hypothetical protein
MRHSLKLISLYGLFVLACAKPTAVDDPSGGGGIAGPGTAGSNGSGQAGSAPSGQAGSAPSGQAGTPGGQAGTPGGQAGSPGTTGAGGTPAPACVPNPTQLINATSWNCDATESIAIQGAIYGYGDGSSCTIPSSGKICTGSGCCISGTTVVDTTFAKWGCGIGMELASSGGGTTATKSVYTGPVKCFDITLTGSSGNNVVRIQFTQSGTPAKDAVAPFTEIPPFTNGWKGQVCFADVTCPSWAVTAMTCNKMAGDGTPVDLQIQVSAGSTTATTGAYNVCATSIVPVTGGGSGGSSGTASCAQASGSGTLTAQFADAHVGCPKDYIVQNNAWGSSAGQTVQYGPGTKMKVTVQNGTGSNGAPASYPSIFTGAYNNRSTTSSGLPRAVSQITATGVNTSWTWSDAGVAATSSYNAAYDVWFSTGMSGDPAASAPSGGYLMVWYHDPSDNQPIGMTIPNGSVTINGKQFNIWYGTNNGKPVVSYVAQQKMTSWSFPLGAFIQDAATRTCSGTTKCINPSWYLTAVFAGFEIWKGGANLETTDFGVTVP